MNTHLLSLQELSGDDLEDIFNLAAEMKEIRETNDQRPLKGKTFCLIFSKSSTRTRVSFEVGIVELGGTAIYLDQSKTQLNRGESVADTARVLSRYLHGIIIRTHEHRDVVELAKHSRIPVINALTNQFHPCQALTDLFTMRELRPDLTGTKLTFLGDGDSNMANSLMVGAKLAGIDMVVAAPPEFKPDLSVVEGVSGEGTTRWVEDPVEAIVDADFIYTDVWVSMGCEKEAEKRIKILSPFQLNEDLLKKGSSGSRVLHCLPAHRGEEITDAVIDGPRSVVFDQAENRLHVQKAILALLARR